MENTIRGYFTSTYDGIYNVAKPPVSAVHETIKLIARYNLKLIAISLACAYFHDYNVVLVYGFAGVVFYKQLDKIIKTVNSIFYATFLITTNSFKPLMEFKVLNCKIFNFPIKVMFYTGSILTFLFLKPISAIFAECLCVAACGADIAKTSRQIAKEFKEKEKEKEKNPTN